MRAACASRPGVVAIAALLCAIACAPGAEAIFSRLQNIREDVVTARTVGPVTEDELLGRSPTGIVLGIGTGIFTLLGIRDECKSALGDIYFGCAAQTLYLLQTRGAPLFYPRVYPELFTPEYLSEFPLPPTERCCKGAWAFQTHLCGCDPEVIRGLRDIAGLDPEVTEPFADWLYGEQCGSPVILGSRCPNGNPFEILRSQAQYQ